MLMDSSKIADNYWYLASFFYTKNIIDSSYYYYQRANNLYSQIGATGFAASTQINMAIIQKNVKDYIGSEVKLISAVKKLKSLKQDRPLYQAYNILGVVNNELKKYDKAINFHKQALSYEKNINDPVLRASSFNNIGVVYSNQKEFKKSLEYYKKALSIDSIYFKNPRLFAMLTDNVAYSNLKLRDTTEIKDDFFRALRIRDSINHIAGIITNNLHLGEYYLFSHDTINAIKYFDNAKELSEEFQSYSDLMESLLFLAKIENKKSSKYYQTYVSLNDSLQDQERLVRNKFARIRFETDEYISKNENLNQQNKYILAGSFGVLLLLILAYFIRSQKLKNRELLLVQEQQNANVEIYNLLLDSQNKLEEGKEKEKQRISQDLHDDILSKFFGIRLNLELLNKKKDPEAIEKREKYLLDLKILEKEIRDISHKLSEETAEFENSFFTILQELFVKQEQINSVKIEYAEKGEFKWLEIDSNIKINLYRIFQEALFNINKYAEATLVNIIIDGERTNQLKIEIIDNGIGFNTERNFSGIGIKNMRSRISEIQGSFKISSSNMGTKISIEVPLKDKTVD